MAFAVAHMLVPMMLIDVFRDNILKIKKNKLPNRYVLIAGLVGLFPDIDLPLSLIFRTFFIHRAFTHSIWIPLTFLVLSLSFYIIKKHKWSLIFFMCFTGIAIHIILDLTYPSVGLFYPLNKNLFGISLFSKTGTMVFYSILDAIILWLWFARIIFRKKIQDIV